MMNFSEFIAAAHSLPLGDELILLHPLHPSHALKTSTFQVPAQEEFSSHEFPPYLSKI